MVRPHHMPALDGLRGIAILLVIAHNAQLLEVPDMHGGLKPAFYLMNIGWVGVQLFFVLSGFLITGILLDTMGRPHALRAFMARRALRIFPLYYGMLFLLFVLLPAIGQQPDIYKAQAPYQIWLWTYLSNWTDPMGIGPDQLPHFWSLAVEEQFYLFWPLLVYALKSPVRVAWAALALVLLGPICRTLVINAGYPVGAAYAWTFCRIDALALGALAATCWRIPACESWIRHHSKQLFAAVFGVFLLTGAWSHGFSRTTPQGMEIGYSGLAIIFAALVYRSAHRDSLPLDHGLLTLWHRMLRTPLLGTIGKYSYGMYVFHKPLHDLFSAPLLSRLGLVPQGNVLHASVHLLAVTLCSFVVAWVSYNLYEVHFLRLKQHFN